MRTHHIRRIISSALVLGVVGCVWYLFAPLALGGSTTYVVTDGVSMEPRFHTGDLALVRSQSSYHVGEIVAYRNKMLHTIVLHRIVGREGPRYLFKGDNNNFVDFEHPLRSQLVGSLWLHIPGAGTKLHSIGSPLLVGILVALGSLMFTGVAFTRKRRRRRRTERAQDSVPAPRAPATAALAPLSADVLAAMLAAAGLALLALLVLALLAFTRPASAHHGGSVPYKQTGSISYSAVSRPGPTYPGDRAVTGEPLFTRVLNTVDFGFSYTFAASARHEISGVAQLSATMTSENGWRSTFPLSSTAHFHGDRVTVSAAVELSSLLAVMHRVQLDTGVNSSYTLTLTPHVSAHGELDGRPLQAHFTPHVPFSINELEVRPLNGEGRQFATGKELSSQFAPQSSGAVAVQRDEPLFISFAIFCVSVATARALALGGMAAVICMLIAVLSLARRTRDGDEAQTIRARHGHLIVPVARVRQPAGVPVIDVADIDALARVAEHYERSILHERAGGLDAYWVADESGHFRYLAGGVGEQRGESAHERPRAAQAPPAPPAAAPTPAVAEPALAAATVPHALMESALAAAASAHTLT
ncbi:MAG TPA: signal peptidase I, partial [Solirubrobacteraceae bacterium]|nr:signal peptidase I [Solirubrobacteraceae bacterium]